MKSCDIHQKNIHLALDGELPAIQQAELVLHLASCPECQAIQKDVARVSKAVAWASQVPSNFGLPTGFQDRFLERLNRSPVEKHAARWLRPTLVAASALFMLFTWQAVDRWTIASSSYVASTMPIQLESERIMISSLQSAVSETERNKADQEAGQLLGRYL